jgi:hypothetical protein
MSADHDTMVHIEQSGQSAMVRTERVELRASWAEGGLSISLAAGYGQERFVPVLERIGHNHPQVPLAAEMPHECQVEVLRCGGAGEMIVQGSVGPARMLIHFRVLPDSPWVQVSELLCLDGLEESTTVDWFEAAWHFVDWREDGEVFSPSLAPQEQDVIGRERFTRAALRWADRLAKWVFPQSRWIDFEVYYSCSPKPLNFYDSRSGQWPQNLLSMHLGAAGLLELHALTGRQDVLELAHRAMDRLSLYQQVWDPPFLNFCGLGGYAAQNTDGEWSDARQGQFADTHLDFWRQGGQREHLERAQARHPVLVELGNDDVRDSQGVAGQDRPGQALHNRRAFVRGRGKIRLPRGGQVAGDPVRAAANGHGDRHRWQAPP